MSNMPPVPPPLPTAARPRGRNVLATLAYVCVILATAGYGCRSIREEVAAAAAKATLDPAAFESSSYTNANAAHITLTNLKAYPLQTCIRGVIRTKGMKAERIETVAVCSGEVKPRSTVVLEAPWHVGAVEKLCSGEPDRFGNTHLEWDRCSYDLEPVN